MKNKYQIKAHLSEAKFRKILWYFCGDETDSKDEFVRGKSHINGIESFWSFAKRRLAKFNGLTDEQFNLHLKECELR